MEAPACSKTGQSTITETFSDEGKIHAKVLWSIKHVLLRCSNNSLKDTITLFQKMFPDSKVSSKMKLGPGKICYVVNRGITLYFLTILKDEILLSGCFVVSFDESLNQVTQQCEMDFYSGILLRKKLK